MGNEFYYDFKKRWTGKSADVDGYYGPQCWDGAMQYSRELGYPVFSCTVTGYVQDIWTQRKTSGILNYYNEVTNLQAGDIVVFRPVAGITPLSHIAMFDSDAGNGYGNFFGQNQGNVSGFSIQALPYSATYDTAFRPKKYVTNTATATKKTQSYGNVNPVNNMGLYYQAHVQDYGWREAVHDGQIAGSTGEGKRLEALRIDLSRFNGKLKLNVKVHIQDKGWVEYKDVKPSTVIGTTGKSKRIEAIEITPTENETGKKLYYEVHIQDAGWTGKMESGNADGTTGISKRLEAVRIWLE